MMLSCAALTQYTCKPQSANTSGYEPQSVARERIHQQYFPDVTLRTQDNKKVRFYEDLIKNKIVTINFFYAKCEGVCPGITANLVRVQRLLGERVGREICMYSISLKRDEDNATEIGRAS